ncbi:hypothetical protein P154DRAFT_452545 [Amniculicola lignicola CBS 123094]|uniref:Uncharacterized protein n=1 Tax=Amniculicola lignicola CBS 123094 TaxID=1392246 RepID=A0A6A5W4W5_9PLEO|nr:hypothetical protein P154DRAFT_452545 [Amniculicola lignicola CBS 123094]
MKLTIASATLAIASFAHLAVASDCTPGIKYCGYNLLAKGEAQNYAEQIRVQLMIEWQDEKDPDNINNSLFACRSKNSALMWMWKCENGCVDGGPGQHDYCA